MGAKNVPRPRPQYDRFKAVAKRIVLVPKREADAMRQFRQGQKPPRKRP